MKEIKKKKKIFKVIIQTHKETHLVRRIFLINHIKTIDLLTINDLLQAIIKLINKSTGFFKCIDLITIVQKYLHKVFLEHSLH